MIGRIVEVVTDGAHISVERGFLAVTTRGERLGRVALDDVGALVVHGHGATFSANLVSRLAERGTPMVICGANHAPTAVVWPVDGHHEQGLRMRAQADAGRPTRKRLWRDLVRGKLRTQAAVLSAVGQPYEALNSLAKRVRSGDSDNLEAQAARRYWPLMMGSTFRRDRHAADVNAFLNYGYIVLRTAAARSIIAAGLHPSLSIHHLSRGDALRLADDLMEPFRPYVDRIARELREDGCEELDRDAKASLAAVAVLDLEGPRGASPLQSCLDRLAQSLAQVYLGEAESLVLPNPPVALVGASRVRR